MQSPRSDEDPRPVDPHTGTPLGPFAQPGYYPRYRTLDQRKFWDAKTREVVLDRVQNVPEFRFFDQHQSALLTAVCERVLPQADRDADHKIPVAPQIDKRLYEDKHDGYRYEQMPPDREAFPMALTAIDEMAHAHYKRGFLELRMSEQDELLRSLHDGKPIAAHDVWNRMPPHRFWLLLVQDCAAAYYAHPWAWDEIGFGGPAYPRAYMRLERGEPEPWETEEERYDWAAPPASHSDQYEPVGGQSQHHATPGQGGTH